LVMDLYTFDVTSLSSGVNYHVSNLPRYREPAENLPSRPSC